VAIPLLEYPPSSQNQRVVGYEVGSDEQPKIYSTENLLSSSDMGDLIEAAYRQIFFHAFATDRERFLESQLRNGQITVRDFVRGLLLSDTYRRSFYDLNNNYRFVEQTVQRALGRDVYNNQEKLAWSITVATKGIVGFVDQLLNSPEYIEAFGYDTLPYQRRRVLPGRAQGETPSTSSLLATKSTLVASLGSLNPFGSLLFGATFLKIRSSSRVAHRYSSIWREVSMRAETLLQGNQPQTLTSMGLFLVVKDRL
jgi:Phycobilisome Linker polypeptide